MQKQVFHSLHCLNELFDYTETKFVSTKVYKRLMQQEMTYRRNMTSMGWTRIATTEKRSIKCFQDAVDCDAPKYSRLGLGSGFDWKMSLRLARAAFRFIFEGILAAGQKGEAPQEVTLLTGVGRGQRMGGKDDDGSPDFGTGSNRDQRRFITQRSATLREYVLQVLDEDFATPLHGTVPKRGQGTVVIEKTHIEDWLTKQ
jgi:hypothetical protein